MQEPNDRTKYVLQDFSNDVTEWFETAEDAADYLTEHALIDTDDFACYEVGKELKFKLVPT